MADGKQYANLGRTFDEWLKAMTAIVANVISCLASDGVIVIITEDVLRKGEHIPVAYRISRLLEDAGLLPRATIYNPTRNYIESMGPAQMKAARMARLHVNDCKVIQVAKVPNKD